MHLLDRLFWTAARLFPAVASAPWISGAVRGEGDRIGADWPRRHAAALGLTLRETPDRGLIPDLSRLDGPTFSTASVPAMVRRFYEQTGRFDIELDARWQPPFRWGAAAWGRLFTRRWGQLELPSDPSTPLTHEVYTLEPTLGPFWVRRYPGTDRALYVSRYDVVDVPGRADPHLRIVFPVPGGAWMVLFAAALTEDGLVLTEDGGVPGGPGLYLVPSGAPARYVAFLREEITVRGTPDGLSAVHTFTVFGLRILTLSYRASFRGTAR